VTRPAILTRRARQELARAVRWIAKDNPDAAAGLNDAVLEAARLIGHRPTVGAHRLHLAGSRYRFWSIPRYHYLLVYTDATEPPRILRLLHMSRDLAPQLVSMRDPGDDLGDG
jgi:plasmid stabilization system protein ParE